MKLRLGPVQCVTLKMLGDSSLCTIILSFSLLCWFVQNPIFSLSFTVFQWIIMFGYLKQNDTNIGRIEIYTTYQIHYRCHLKIHKFLIKHKMRKAWTFFFWKYSNMYLMFLEWAFVYPYPYRVSLSFFHLKFVIWFLFTQCIHSRTSPNLSTNATMNVSNLIKTLQFTYF